MLELDEKSKRKPFDFGSADYTSEKSVANDASDDEHNKESVSSDDEETYNFGNRFSGKIKPRGSIHLLELYLGEETLVTNRPTDYARFFDKIDSNEELKENLAEVGRKIVRKCMKGFAHQVVTIGVTECKPNDFSSDYFLKNVLNCDINFRFENLDDLQAWKYLEIFERLTQKRMPYLRFTPFNSFFSEDVPESIKVCENNKPNSGYFSYRVPNHRVINDQQQANDQLQLIDFKPQAMR